MPHRIRRHPGYDAIPDTTPPGIRRHPGYDATPDTTPSRIRRHPGYDATRDTTPPGIRRHTGYDVVAGRTWNTLAGAMPASDDDGGMTTGGDEEAVSNCASEKAALAADTTSHSGSVTCLKHMSGFLRLTTESVLDNPPARIYSGPHAAHGRPHHPPPLARECRMVARTARRLLKA
jgi:hypothetical protein